jgi:hypothetical protein
MDAIREDDIPVDDTPKFVEEETVVEDGGIDEEHDDYKVDPRDLLDNDDE